MSYRNYPDAASTQRRRAPVSGSTVATTLASCVALYVAVLPNCRFDVSPVRIAIPARAAAIDPSRHWLLPQVSVMQPRRGSAEDAEPAPPPPSIARPMDAASMAEAAGRISRPTVASPPPDATPVPVVVGGVEIAGVARGREPVPFAFPTPARSLAPADPNSRGAADEVASGARQASRGAPAIGVDGDAIAPGRRDASAAAPPEIARGRRDGEAARRAPFEVASLPPPSGRRLWEHRSVSVALRGGEPMIAIILDDIGLERSRTDRVIALPGPLTLAFLPQGRESAALAARARAQGHEILLHMPMQSVGGADPGPNSLTVDLTPVEIRMRVSAALDRFGDAIGLNNHMGSLFTADPMLMEPVIRELALRGLAFIDSRTANDSKALLVAREMGVASIGRDVFIDHDPSRDAVLRQLAEAERIARRQGYAVAIGHPFDTTLSALSQWLPQATERGVQIVPVSAVIRRVARRGNVLTE